MTLSKVKKRVFHFYVIFLGKQILKYFFISFIWEKYGEAYSCEREEKDVWAITNNSIRNYFEGTNKLNRKLVV